MNPFLRLIFSTFLALSFAATGLALDAVLTDDISLRTDSGAIPPRGDRPKLLLSEEDTVYLKFDLNSVLPTGITSARIEKATLWIWVNSASQQGNIAVYPVLNSWNERNRSALFFLYQSPPPWGPRVAFKAAGIVHQFVVFDVTSTVRDWVDGVPNHGFALRSYAINFFTQIILPDSPPVIRTAFSGAIDSKENPATSHLPRLQITLTNAN